MSHLSETSAFEAFARMEEKIDQNERQIRASTEIDEEMTGDRLTNDFKQLERASGGNADMQLLALKQRMGMLAAPAASEGRKLSAGQPARTEEELIAEFEELPGEKKPG